MTRLRPDLAVLLVSAALGLAAVALLGEPGPDRLLPADDRAPVAAPAPVRLAGNGAPPGRALAARARSGNATARAEAAAALGDVAAAPAGTAVPALADALSDTEPVVRIASLRALARWGPAAEAALPALLALATTAEGREQELAQRTLGAVGAGRRDVLEVLRAGLFEPRVDAATAAAQGLLLYGAEGVEALLAAARDDEDVASLLPTLGVQPASPSEAERLRPLLEGLLEGARSPLHAAALRSLEASGRWARASVAALIRLLPAAREHDRVLVIEALGAVGEDSEEAQGALRQLESDPDPRTRAAASRSLAN